ncbi:MAG TPA: hypothetical protein VIX19_02125 [Terriglobales bacterium]
MKSELRPRLYYPIPEVDQWLRSVVSGHFRYFGVPMNTPALHIFRFQTGRLWQRAQFQLTTMLVLLVLEAPLTAVITGTTCCARQLRPATAG